MAEVVFMEGVVMKRTRRVPKRWQMKWMRLVTDQECSEGFLEYFSPPEPPTADSKRTIMNLAGVNNARAVGGSVIELMGVKPNSKPLFLRAANGQEAGTWAAALTSVIQRLKAVSPQDFTVPEVADDDRGKALMAESEMLLVHPRTVKIDSGSLASELSDEVRSELMSVFSQFARFGAGQVTNVDTIDGARFAKLCREARIMNQTVNSVSVDIVFAKVKRKGERRITYEQFLDALSMLSVERGVAAMELVTMLLESHGPRQNNTTHADFVRFHDDKSTYTGVYSRGGPAVYTNYANPELFSDGLRREMHRPQSATISKASPVKEIVSDDFQVEELSPVKLGSELIAMLGEDITELRELFWSFCAFGADRRKASAGGNSTKEDDTPALDGARFIKLFRDCGLLDDVLTVTEIDIIFSRVRASTVRHSATRTKLRRISFLQFLGALNIAADVKGVGPTTIVAELLAIGHYGPQKTDTTTAEFVALHDDKRTYTGVYSRGGPDVRLDKSKSLRHLLARAPIIDL